jgi:hypothetical protein
VDVDRPSALTGSWLAVRMGIDPVRLDLMRRSGELYAVRPAGSEDWLYPAWQFGEDGQVRPAVSRALEEARKQGLSQAELEALLEQRVGLAGGRRMFDLLAEGDDEAVVSAIRAG